MSKINPDLGPLEIVIPEGTPSRFNTTSYFVLPFIAKNELANQSFTTRDFGEYMFLNAYLSPDHKNVIVEVDGERLEVPHGFEQSPDYIAKWGYKDNVYFEYAIPEGHYPDVQSIIEGRYSKVSTGAKKKIIEAIEMKKVPTPVTKDQLNRLQMQVTNWPHLISYFLPTNYILPIEYIVILGDGAEPYKQYKSHIEHSLGCRIPKGVDPMDKMNMEEETIDLTIYKQKQEYEDAIKSASKT